MYTNTTCTLDVDQPIGPYATCSTARGGIPTSMGNLPERLSRQILAGVILVGRLGVIPRVVALALTAGFRRLSAAREPLVHGERAGADRAQHIYYNTYHTIN